MRKLRGIDLYLAVVASLRQWPAGVSTLAPRVNLSPTSTRVVVRLLLDLGVLRITRWRKGCGRPTRVFGIADGRPNAPPPPGSTIKTERLPHTRVEAVAFATLWRTLEEASSIVELTEASGLNEGTVRRHIRFAHELRIVGIAEWQPSGAHHHRAAYKRLASDVPRPQPITYAEQLRRSAERRRASYQQARMTFRLPPSRGYAAQPEESR